MKVAVFVGGNKDFTANRLSVKLAEDLQYSGHSLKVWAIRGKVKFCPYVPLKEYAAILKTKALAVALQKEKTARVISFMNLPACEAAIEAGLPFVYVEEEGFKEDKVIKNKKEILKKAQRVIVVKRTGKPLNKRSYAGLPLFEVPNPAVWVERENGPKPACFARENNVLAIGKLAKESGFDVLLKAWAQLAPAHATWHLTIAGDGTSKASLSKFISKNNLQDHVTLVPASSDLYSLLGSADIFVCPALDSARADILLDAMASKLPCVVGEIFSSSEWMIPGVNGMVVNAAKVEGLAQALDEMMVNWGKRVGMALEANKLKDKYPFSAFSRFIIAVPPR